MIGYYGALIGVYLIVLALLALMQWRAEVNQCRAQEFANALRDDLPSGMNMGMASGAPRAVVTNSAWCARMTDGR